MLYISHAAGIYFDGRQDKETLVRKKRSNEREVESHYTVVKYPHKGNGRIGHFTPDSGTGKLALKF